ARPTDNNIAQNTRPAADIDAIFNDWDFGVSVAMRHAKCRIVPNMNVIADRARVQHHSTVVPDSHSPAELGRVWQRNSTGPLDPLKKEIVQERKWRPQQLWLNPHSPVAEPMHRDGPKALFEKIPVVRAQVLVQKRQEPDSRRVIVDVALWQRPDWRGHGRGLDKGLGRKLNFKKSRSMCGGSRSGLPCKRRRMRQMINPTVQAIFAMTP